MAATTTAHLRTAIIEALTTDRTASYARAIASTYLFRVGMPPGVDATIRSVRHSDKPGAFVVVESIEPESGPGTELGSDHIYRCQIVISRDYYLGHDMIAADIADAFQRCGDDAMRIRAALCYPGALDQTAAGNATGLGPEALRPLALNKLSVDRIGNGSDRLLNARDAYVGHFLYQPS